ncbi:serine protease [uncultured Xanthomonas sp.]|uniref:S1 family peptidase n=1 Tax=uncultured Xanthomonas sp. TaxID=152831 RepID=UPI00374A0B8E
MFNFSAVSNLVFALGRNGPGGVQLLGTAFALNKPGLFATASHVAGTEGQNLVLAFKRLTSLHDYQDTGDNSIQLFPVQIHALDPFHDLAVLKADVDGASNLIVGGADDAPVGTQVVSFGFPHADHGRMVLTQQDAEIGARVLIASGGIKVKHFILNTQARPGQSGSPIFRKTDGRLIGVIVGSYAPGGGGGISLGGVDPHTLHQTTHAVSAEYLSKMY